MPRKARIDASGALHHIICRGIEKRNIFRYDTDKNDFIDRLSRVVSETQTSCYAWALLNNHLHLLLRTGNVPIAKVMQKILTGYVVSFNRRYRRHGHLFQNRYKSILCQEDQYFLELVRYIHLNPLRAKLVDSIQDLDKYSYSGHSIIMGKKKVEWQDVAKVLNMFGSKASSARNHYREFIIKGIEMGKRPDLIGGGLVRSSGGWQAVKAFRRNQIHLKGDERILGDSDFVLQVLNEQKEQMERRFRLRACGYDFDKVVERVAILFGLSRQEILGPSRQRLRVTARSILCYWAIRELGMKGAEISRMLKINQSSVSRAVSRGEKFVNERKLKLIDN